MDATPALHQSFFLAKSLEARYLLFRSFKLLPDDNYLEKISPEKPTLACNPPFYSSILEPQICHLKYQLDSIPC